MKRIASILTCLLLAVSLQAQETAVTGSRKAVRTSGDVGAVLLPVAGLTAILLNKDWQGLKQGVFAGAATLGVTYALKFSFTAATFIQRRYGWKWGVPAYVLSTYVGWSRVYGKKHDWWDVAAGAVIGAGSSLIFTRPFAKKHHLTLSPVAGDGHCGFYMSMKF